MKKPTVATFDDEIEKCLMKPEIFYHFSPLFLSCMMHDDDDLWFILHMVLDDEKFSFVFSFQLQ